MTSGGFRIVSDTLVLSDVLVGFNYERKSTLDKIDVEGSYFKVATKVQFCGIISATAASSFVSLILKNAVKAIGVGRWFDRLNGVHT